jgi:hypothetical protein
MPYALLSPAVCRFMTTAASPSSPQPAGTTITFGNDLYPCSGGEYQFLELAPGGTWTTVQAYGVGTSFVWNSTGTPNGRYEFGVRERKIGSGKSYDTYVIVTYYIGT